MTHELEKRTHVMVQRPTRYEMSGCACGNHDPDWSEFKGHLWCGKCQKDFIPECGGIFDGPIPVATVGLLGISLDQINIETGQLEPFEFTTPPAETTAQEGK